MPAARRKRRTTPHVNEERSREILRAALPAQWAIHGYAPDYGIDGVVELFEYLPDDNETAETLGESFFFQLKSLERTVLSTRTVKSRLNVEKFPLSAKHQVDETAALEVIAYPLETDELLTIEAMGTGISVLLVLAGLDLERTFFVCLTDYIDKVLTPEDPTWREKGTKTIYVPTRNCLERDSPLLILLRLYAIRPKLMGMFTKVHFQWAELMHATAEQGLDGFIWMARHFVDRLLQLDVWNYPGWELLGYYRDQLTRLQPQLIPDNASADLADEIITFWFRMDTISRTHEELMREAALPTLLAQHISYPS